MARAQVAASLAQLLSPLEAHELEHAFQTCSLSAGVSYERTALRCLHLLEHEPGARERLRQLGPHGFAAAPLECIVDQVPVKDAVATAEEERRGSEALLRLLTQGEATAAPLPDTGLRCTKCGSNEVLQQLLQTRSADEGSTIFCTCTKCKKRWKM